MATQINIWEFNEQAYTTNSTATTLNYRTPPQNSSSYFTLNVVARRDDGATKSWTFSGNYKRGTGDSTVSLQLLGNLGTTSDLLALLTAGATADNSGADVRIRITGISGSNIYWYASMAGQEIQIT